MSEKPFLFNLTKLGGKQASESLTDPQKLFNALPKKDRRYSYLRDVQAEVFAAWRERRSKKDTLVKLNTGAGKTVVGLLLLKASVNEGIGPGLYVAPDNNLASQVLAEAAALGIETTNDPRSADYQSSRAIGVVNINKLVNGRSIFGVGREGQKIEIGTVVIDDAHACLGVTEEQFSLRYPREHSMFAKLFEVFKDDLAEQSSTIVAEIQSGDPQALAVVPFWAWSDKHNKVAATLAQAPEDEHKLFSWPLIKNTLKQCRCVFSSAFVEISPPCMPINEIPSFLQAKRRIYMTATLTDDGVLVSDFGASPDQIEYAITPRSASDLGDRLILVPQVLNPKMADQDVQNLITSLARKNNVVVVVPSKKRAESFWKPVATQTLTAENIHEGISRLRAGHVGLTVLVNKYDGIDLPNDACRVLVLDGLPDTRRLRDKVEKSVVSGSDTFQRRQIQKLEQGMGRGIRSNDDYCVVILMGAALTQQVYRAKTRSLLTPATAAQMQLADQVGDQLKLRGAPALQEIIKIFLSRNPEWVTAAKSAVADVEYPQKASIEPVTLAQRKAFDRALIGQYRDAAAALEKAKETSSDPDLQAWLLEQIAAYTHEFDQVEAQKMLMKAREKSLYVTRPRAGVEYKTINLAANEQAFRASRYLRSQYHNKNEVLIGINGLQSNLSYQDDSAEDFEEALYQLGLHVGLSAQRPEKHFGGGVDVLWALGDLRYAVISCKSEASSKFIAKKYADNLSGSVNWFKRYYDASCRVTPVIAHPVRIFDSDASPHEETRVIDQERLELLRAELRAFADGVGDRFGETEFVRERLAHHNLVGSQLLGRFTVGYSVKKK